MIRPPTPSGVGVFVCGARGMQSAKLKLYDGVGAPCKIIRSCPEGITSLGNDARGGN